MDQKVIDLSEFTKKTVIVKLGRINFILQKPSVNQFLDILERTESIGKDNRKDVNEVIDILCMLVKNKGLFGWKRWYLRKLLCSLDDRDLMIVRNQCFLVLGLVESPAQREAQKTFQG